MVAIDAVDGGKEAIEIKQSFKGLYLFSMSYISRRLSWLQIWLVTGYFGTSLDFEAEQIVSGDR